MLMTDKKGRGQGKGPTRDTKSKATCLKCRRSPQEGTIHLCLKAPGADHNGLCISSIGKSSKQSPKRPQDIRYITPFFRRDCGHSTLDISANKYFYFQPFGKQQIISKQTMRRPFQREQKKILLIPKLRRRFMLTSLPVGLSFAFPQHTVQPRKASFRESMGLGSLRIREELGEGRFPHLDPKTTTLLPTYPIEGTFGSFHFRTTRQGFKNIMVEIQIKITVTSLRTATPKQ